MKLTKITPQNLAILSLLVITVLAVGVSVWAVFFRASDTPLVPDYAPKELESNQKPIPGDTGDKLEQPENGGAVSITFSNEVTVKLNDRTITLLFANPRRSGQDMVIQLVIRDTVIVQSGRIVPGNQVSVLTLGAGMEQRLLPGGYDGKFVIHYYDPETGEKAIVNTEIPITVTVQE